MELRIAYGREGLRVKVPDNATVVLPKDLPALPDEQHAVLESIRSPMDGPTLSDLVPSSGNVVIVFPDITRPMPNQTVLPPLLAELEEIGVNPNRILLLCATGPSTAWDRRADRVARARHYAEVSRQEPLGRHLRLDGRRQDRWSGHRVEFRLRPRGLAHCHRLCRAAFLRGLQWWSQGSVPWVGWVAHHFGSPQPGADR